MPRLGDNLSSTAVVCVHIWRAGAKVTQIDHHSNGHWNLTCEREHAPDDPMFATLVGAVVQRDPAVTDVGDLASGGTARRNASGQAWVVDPEERGLAKVASLARGGLARLAMRLRPGPGPSDAQIRDVLARVGWVVMTIDGDTTAPPFAYTIGLFDSFSHPELILFMPRLDQAGPMLNACAAKVKSGLALTEDTLLDEVMASHPVGFRAFDMARYPDHLGRAIAFYRAVFPAVQVCWPDRHGRFPWDPACVREVREAQPLAP